MWRRRHRIRRLEEEVATARADQAELRRRLEMFEMIAGAAGAALPDLPSRQSTAAPVPASLVAAAQSVSPHQAPIRLLVGDTDLIAVVGGPGDPREWWSAVCRVATRSGETS